MSNRRMFSKRLVSSARFLKMPLTSQLLYFHLGMHADDDGIVEAYPIIKMVGCGEDDLKVLVAKGYVQVLNEDLVAYITDWSENNTIRTDRKIDSIYKDLLLQILPYDNQLTTKCQPIANQVTTNCQPNDRISKDKLSKDKLSKVNIENPTDSSSVYRRILNRWNELQAFGIKPIRGITGKREESVRSRIRQFGEGSIFEAISKISESDFLQGKNGRGWMITFDWFVAPSNFQKVLEGNYDNGSYKPKDKYSQRIEDVSNWGKQFEEQN